MGTRKQFGTDLRQNANLILDVLSGKPKRRVSRNSAKKDIANFAIEYGIEECEKIVADKSLSKEERMKAFYSAAHLIVDGAKRN